MRELSCKCGSLSSPSHRKTTEKTQPTLAILQSLLVVRLIPILIQGEIQIVLVTDGYRITIVAVRVPPTKVGAESRNLMLVEWCRRPAAGKIGGKTGNRIFETERSAVSGQAEERRQNEPIHIQRNRQVRTSRRQRGS